MMKQFLTIVTTAIALVALSSSTFADDCGPCTGGGEKSKDKKTESTQS
jgi:hypothetical protein